MENKKLIPCIYISKGKAVKGFGKTGALENDDILMLAKTYSDGGADELLIFDFSDGDEEHEQSIGIIKEISRVIDMPMIVGGNVKRLEDVKKLLYAGAGKVMLNYSKQENIDLTEEVSKRFGRDKIAACVNSSESVESNRELIKEMTGTIVLMEEDLVDEVSQLCDNPIIVVSDARTENTVVRHLKKPSVAGVAGKLISNMDTDIMKLKYLCSQEDIPMNTFKSALAFHKFKLNNDGLIPVIVQDYKTDEVLMLAYMNEEAFDHTIKTGKMTYYSRSRKELWLKGETSGHFQYVKTLMLDCDNDTILAKVAQVGVACHTGRHSCFFQTLVMKEYQSTNPLKVFENVYDVIADRKANPKEGSYTNYLFDKGIDKILKKVGEEATEIVIAAKNPDSEEIKYEISDFLYHAMVLMVEKGVTWEDITKELAQR